MAEWIQRRSNTGICSHFVDIGADILDLSGATIEGENIREEAVREL
jgi:hypothetical protein